MLSTNKPTDFLMSSLGEIVGASAWIALQDETIIAGNPPDYLSQKLNANPETFAQTFNGVPISWQGSTQQANPAIVVTTPLSGFAQPAVLFLAAPIKG